MLTAGFYYRSEFKANKDLVVYSNKDAFFCSSLSGLMWFEWFDRANAEKKWFNGEILKWLQRKWL